MEASYQRIIARVFLGVFLGAFFLVPNSAWAKFAEGDDFPLAQLATDFVAKKGKFAPDKSKGKAYIIDFWASWCEPCKKALPALDKLYKKHKNQGLVIIGVNVDDEKGLGKGFLKDHPVSFPMVYDQGKKLAESAGLATMPTSFVLDRDGKIVHVHKGFVDGQEAEYASQVKKILKK